MAWSSKRRGTVIPEQEAGGCGVERWQRPQGHTEKLGFWVHCLFLLTLLVLVAPSVQWGWIWLLSNILFGSRLPKEH